MKLAQEEEEEDKRKGERGVENEGEERKILKSKDLFFDFTNES